MLNVWVIVIDIIIILHKIL